MYPGDGATSVALLAEQSSTAPSDTESQARGHRELTHNRKHLYIVFAGTGKKTQGGAGTGTAVVVGPLCCTVLDCCGVLESGGAFL